MLSIKKQACFQARPYSQPVSYGDRLNKAIELAKTNRKALGLALGISEQAVGMVIRGDTRALTAENSALAARTLRVDHYWLATGEGEPRPQNETWPFHGFSAAEFYQLDEALRDEVEDRLVGAIQRLNRKQSLGEMSSRSLASGGRKN